MAPGKWDDEESEDSTPPTSPAPIARRKFDDEEEDDDVLESWDAADDSETEREKTKKAEEAKAKAEAEARANKKSKAQRIEEHRLAAQRLRELEDSSDEESEDEAERRARLRETEKNSDLRHAEDLFGDLQGTNNRSAVKPVVIADTKDPTSAVDLSAMPLFNPNTKEQFTRLRDTLVPLVGANAQKAQYTLFMQEFVKQVCKELPSDQIKKIASGLTTLSNEKMKEEKLAEKGGKKTKAKAKTVLKADRSVGSKTYADTSVYDDDGLDDGDFM